MRSDEELKQSIQKGIEWLNNHIPSWRKNIKFDLFDIGSHKFCVLSQASRDCYSEATARYGLSHEKAVELALNGSSITEQNRLTQLWKEALTKINTNQINLLIEMTPEMKAFFAGAKIDINQPISVSQFGQYWDYHNGKAN